MKKKLILLSQPVLRHIDETEMLAAAGAAEVTWPRRVVMVEGQDEADEAIRTGDWSRAQARVERAFRDLVKPVIDADGDVPLLDGFRSRNGALVRGALAGIFSQVVR